MATKFIKKNKDEETFDSSKIYKSIINAMKSGSGLLRPKIAQVIKEEADEKFGKKDNVHSKEIDKFIISKLNEYGQELTAYAYERYKTTKAYQEAVSIIDNDIFGIVDGTNSAALDENSNKDGQLISTQRDLIAGIESRSYVERHLMPTHLLNAHREGLIHIHDTDYMIHRGCFNCSLINGNVYMGDPLFAPADVNFTADGAQMGSVIKAKKRKYALSLSFSNTSESMTLRFIINGKCARSETVHKGEYSTELMFEPQGAVSFVRAELYCNDRCIMLTNPIYFVTDTFSGDIPKERLVEL